jgi:hypothetical protein
MNPRPSSFVAVPPPNAFDVFQDLSVVLTGFDLADLLATGMGRRYFDELLNNAGIEATGAMLQAFAEIVREYPERDQSVLDAVAVRIMEPFAPLAQNVITMWYLGRWNQLPGPWRATYGASAADQDHIISPEAYVEGLVWKAIDSHPRSAKAPGFGTWAVPPNVPHTIPPNDDTNR